MKVTVGEMVPRVQSSGCGLMIFSMSGVAAGVGITGKVGGTTTGLVGAGVFGGTIEIAGVAVAAGAVVFDPLQAVNTAIAASNAPALKIRFNMIILAKFEVAKATRIVPRSKQWTMNKVQ
jgi:hypothetical protein